MSCLCTLIVSPPPLPSSSISLRWESGIVGDGGFRASEEPSFPEASPVAAAAAAAAAGPAVRTAGEEAEGTPPPAMVDKEL